MNTEEFKRYGHQLIDWISDYYEDIEQYPVKSQVKPQEVYEKIPPAAPVHGEPFERIMEDFNSTVMPGITHWQHPSFFAYFNANTSYPSILGELLTSAIAAQCMVWETSPAAAELEQRVCEWLRQASGLPDEWEGVIQDTASTATLCALLMAREKHSGFAINQHGFTENEKYTIYCSTEAHSSIEKDVKIAGFGSEQLVKVPVDDRLAMIPQKLEEQIEKDIRAGLIPLCVVAAIGTTGTHAIDPIKQIGEICEKHAMFFHVDAAHAGNAALLPEFRWLLEGIEYADSYVFNPHKWMFTNFDCSILYTRDKASLIRTFEIMPEYLKTETDQQVNNYRDWGIQLGRRFRALKLWFVLRSFGLEGIISKFRLHIELAKDFAGWLEEDQDFELLAPVPLNLVCFRYHPKDIGDDDLNALNSRLEKRLNASGKVYITHTKVQDKYTLRACIGQTNVERRHVEQLYNLLKKEAAKISLKHS